MVTPVSLQLWFLNIFVIFIWGTSLFEVWLTCTCCKSTSFLSYILLSESFVDSSETADLGDAPDPCPFRNLRRSLVRRGNGYIQIGVNGSPLLLVNNMEQIRLSYSQHIYRPPSGALRGLGPLSLLAVLWLVVRVQAVLESHSKPHICQV